jgi:hypothetical protein
MGANSSAFRVGVTAVFRIQTWHINNHDALLLDRGGGEDDHARGYYDPDHNEVVITLEAENRHTQEIDPAAHCLVLARLRARWPTARITREDQ